MWVTKMEKKNKAKSIENDDEDTMNLPLLEGNF